MINREMLAKATLNNASSRQVPTRTEIRLPPGVSLTSTPIPVQMTRNNHVTVTLDGTTSVRNLLQQHARPYDDSLLRRQLNKSAVGPAAAVGTAVATSKGQPIIDKSLLAQHLTQKNNELKVIDIVQTEPLSAPPGSVEHGIPNNLEQRRAPPSSPVVNAPIIAPRKILPKPVHSLSFVANGGRVHQNPPVVSVQNATTRVRLVDPPIHAAPNDVITGLKNMAVVHPQVRPAMSMKPIGADELAKEAQLSKTAAQNVAANMTHKIAQPSTTAAAAAAGQRALLEPNRVVPVSIQRSVPRSNVQRVDEDESKKSKMIIVDLTEPMETSPSYQASFSNCKHPARTHIVNTSLCGR
ncbi:hypothetical protein MRX96_035487 [Rhipicephalus microplus]